MHDDVAQSREEHPSSIWKNHALCCRLKDAAAEPRKPRQNGAGMGHLSPSWATFLACLGREVQDMCGYLLAMERFHAREGLPYSLLQLRSSLQVRLSANL